jgi:hypothetical protein
VQESENGDSEAHRRAVTVSGSVLQFRGQVEQEDKDVDDWCCREVVEAFQRAVVKLALELARAGGSPNRAIRISRSFEADQRRSFLAF